MSDKDTKEKGKEEVRAEGRQGFAEMCRRMMSGGAPDCCTRVSVVVRAGQGAMFRTAWHVPHSLV